MGYLLLMLHVLDVIYCLPALEKKRILTKKLKVGVFMQHFSFKIFFFALLEALLHSRSHAEQNRGRGSIELTRYIAANSAPPSTLK